MIVVGLDLSLASTGLARIHISVPGVDGTGRPPAPRVEVARTTTKPTDDTPEARSLRLRRLAATICRSSNGAALVIIEGPAYGSKVGHNHDRSGLWWLVVAHLTGTGIPVAEVPPSTLKTYAVGKGGGRDTDKDAILATVVRRYPDVEVTGNDMADALLLAAMGARYLGHPIEASLPQTHTRALTSVRWPRVPTMEGTPA